MADDLAEMMKAQGAVIRPEIEPGFAEHPFYPSRDPEGYMKSISEVNRALIVGSMEYVPADQIAKVRSESQRRRVTLHGERAAARPSAAAWPRRGQGREPQHGGGAAEARRRRPRGVQLT